MFVKIKQKSYLTSFSPTFFFSAVKLTLLQTYQGIGEQIVKKLCVIVVCMVLVQGTIFSINFVILVVFQNYRLDFIRKYNVQIEVETVA